MSTKGYDLRFFKTLVAFLIPQRRWVAFALGLLFLLTGAQLLQPYLMKVGVDRFITDGERKGLGTLALVYIGALVAQFALMYAYNRVLERTGQNLVLDIRERVFGHLQRQSSAYFDRHPVGRLMTRITTDIEALNEAFTAGLVMMIADAVKVLGIVVILLVLDWRLALVTFCILPLVAALTLFFRLRARRAYQAVRKWVSMLNAYLQENLSGVRVVQSFGQEERSRRRFDELNIAHEEAQLRGVKYESAFSAVAEMMGSITVAALVWAAGKGILEGWTTFGTLVAFIEYSARFFAPIQELGERFTVMQSAMTSAERIVEVLDEKPAITSPVVPIRMPKPVRGRIEFRNVTFGYKPGLPVLHNVNFTIEPGEHIGIVGWTGSGKSTVIRLLSRLYDVWDGEIRVDGINVRDYELEELRRTIGVVLQDPFLRMGTLASNISLNRPWVQDRDVFEALSAVGADEFVAKRQQGLKAAVTERGSNLSLGEKQLISFARVLAARPAILVLDEATASIDPTTEIRIQNSLEKLTRGRTSLTIAHRLVTVQASDRILVLHHGLLAEVGTHNELLQQTNGIYKTLFELQRIAA